MPQAVCREDGTLQLPFPESKSLATYLIGGSLLSGTAELSPGHHWGDLLLAGSLDKCASASGLSTCGFFSLDCSSPRCPL